MLRLVVPAPDHTEELALIEMSRLQRQTGVLLMAGYGAAQLASEYLAELARRETQPERTAA